MKIRSNSLRSLSLLLLITVLLFFESCKDKEYQDAEQNADTTAMSKEDYIKRGEYLVTSIGCADCHSPKRMREMGPEEVAELKLSGYQSDSILPKIEQSNLKEGWTLFSPDNTAAVGPWGVSFAGNITSDNTGIGSWTLDQFKTAMREGKFKGMKDGRDLLPPMPWPSFANLNDEDLESIFRYLQSTKPVKNMVPPPIPPTKLDSLWKG
ncbi:MAG: diheme cytochrome c-553 [Salegentibacter sp.]